MAERLPDEIRAYAELPILTFIDGYIAQIVSMKPAKDNDNNDCWEIIINPSDLLVKRYNLRKNDKGTMLQTFLMRTDMIVQLNADPAHTRWFALQNYLGKTTHVSDLLKGIKQQEEIASLKTQVVKERLRAEVAKENLSLMQNNLPKYITKNFNPIMEAALPLVEKMTKKETN